MHEYGNDDLYYNVNANAKNDIERVALFARALLKYAQRGIPNYPDHGENHSKNMIDLLNSLFEETEQYCKQSVFNEGERYLLYIAAWLHDIGRISLKNEKHHSTTSIIFLNKSRRSCLNHIELETYKPTFECLKVLIMSHSEKGDVNLDTIPREIHIHGPPFSQTYRIRLQFICAIFRLIDECDIAAQRVEEVVYTCIKEELKEDNKTYWEAHLNIYSAKPNIKNESVEIIVSQKEKTEILITSIRKVLNQIQDIFEMYKFPIKRLDIKEEKSKLEHLTKITKI